MAVLDVEQFLEPISPELPCGDDLEYDQEFGEMERAAQPVAEQQFGETVIEGQEPQWKQVRSKALGLLTRTKDLRVAVLLARAVVRTDGLAGFCEAIAVVRGLVQQYWEHVHPQLDPDDGLDPTIRVNTLKATSGWPSTAIWNSTPSLRPIQLRCIDRMCSGQSKL